MAQGSLIDHIELDTVTSAHLHILSVSMAHPHRRPSLGSHGTMGSAQEVLIRGRDYDGQPTIALPDLILPGPDSNYIV